MVRSLNMLVWELIELYRSAHKVTDAYDERLFATWVQATRAKLIKQRLDEGMRLPDEHWVQDLGAVQVTPVDSSSISTILSGRYLLQTVADIPRTIHFKGDPGGFTRIAPADRLEKNFRMVSYERALVSGNGKFNKDEVYSFLNGTKICLISRGGIHKLIEYINIKGVFQNPIDAWEFANPGEDYDWDTEYPVSDSLVNDMKNMIVQENFQLIMIPIEDKKANSIDNITNPAPEQDEAQNPMRRSR